MDEDYEVKTGTVASVEPGRLLVRIERDEDCGGCRSCAVKALCGGRGTGHMELPVKFTGDAPAKTGDNVRIAYRAANAGVASIVMFLPALAGLLLGGMAGNRLAPGSDGTLLLGCLAGVVLGVAVSFLLSKTVASLKPDVKLLPV